MTDPADVRLARFFRKVADDHRAQLEAEVRAEIEELNAVVIVSVQASVARIMETALVVWGSRLDEVFDGEPVPPLPIGLITPPQ